MFLLYYSDGCNTSETVFHWCYVNDLHTTHAVVCWVTTTSQPCDEIQEDLQIYTSQININDSPMTAIKFQLELEASK
jgi:hypothetical protein